MGGRTTPLVAAVLTALAVGAAGCARQRGAGPETASGTIGAADAATLASLLELADTRRADTLAIDRALQSADPRVRALAMRTIGQVRIRARAPALRVALGDADSSIAADAAFALGLLRDSSAASTLGAALAGAPTVIAAAAWALGEIGESARPHLVAVLRSGKPTASLAAALQAAAKLRPVPVADVAPYLTTADPSVRRSAAYALTRSRVPSAVRPLLSVADDRRASTDVRESIAIGAQIDVEFRSYVARGLARTVAGDSLADPARLALERLAEDVHPHVRINAVRSLATFGEDARHALLRRIADPDPNVRIALSQSLNGVLPPRVDDWTRVWSADTAFTYRRTVLSSAMRAGVRLPALASGSGAWHRHPEWRYRAAAAEAVGAGGFAIADEIAGTLLSDRDGRVRNAALAALIPFADSARAAGRPYSRAALARVLDDPDAFVRATALGALRNRARSSDASLALAAWMRASTDADNDARIAALGVIAAAWAADSAGFGRALTDSIGVLAAPTDPLERAAALRIGPLRHWPQSGPAGRASSWYATQVRDVLLPDMAGRPLRATIVTDRGSIEAVLFGKDAPLTVANFIALARRHYFDGLAFHRVVPNFVAQDGDPRGDGRGGPGYAIRDELNRRWYDRGAIGMALSGADTGGSQYFITHSPQPHLDGQYTVFGHITSGFVALDALVQGDRIRSITIR